MKWIRSIKDYSTVNMNRLMFSALTPFAGGTFGILLVVLILTFVKDADDYAKLGGFLALIVGMIVLVISGCLTVQNDFNLAISMGKTRKTIMPAMYVFLFMQTLVTFAAIYIVDFLEERLYAVLYPGFPCEMDYTSFLHERLLVWPLFFGVPALVLFLGALVLKFGNNAFWFVWIFWWVIFMIAPKMMHAATERPDSGLGKIGRAILSLVGRMQANDVTLVSIVVAVAALAGSYALMRKQRVTG